MLSKIVISICKAIIRKKDGDGKNGSTAWKTTTAADLLFKHVCDAVYIQGWDRCKHHLSDLHLPKANKRIVLGICNDTHAICTLDNAGAMVRTCRVNPCLAVVMCIEQIPKIIFLHGSPEYPFGHVTTENGKHFIETHFHHGQRSSHISSQNRRDVTISSSAWRAVMLVDQTVNFVIGLFSNEKVLSRVHSISLVRIWSKWARKCTSKGQRIAKMHGCVEYVWPKCSSSNRFLIWGC